MKLSGKAILEDLPRVISIRTKDYLTCYQSALTKRVISFNTPLCLFDGLSPVFSMQDQLDLERYGIDPIFK